MDGGKWYAVWTKSHCERQVAQQLSSLGFSAFLPEGAVRSTRRGATRLIPAPLFPGYVFVREAMDKHRYIELLKVRGIVRVLEDGWTRLTPIPDADIESIQRLVSAGLPVLPHAHLESGDRVRVTEGPLNGVEGTFIQDKPQKGRLVLSIDLLGRSVSVDVDSAHITPCSTRH